jgi:hypothetical protein
VAQHIKGTQELHLVLSPTSTQLHCSVDSSFACHQDGKGNRDTIIQLGEHGGIIHTSSKELPIVTLSTAEAELIALSLGAQGVVWLHGC